MENGVGWQIFTGELEWGATGGPLSCIVTIVTNYTIRVSITDPKSAQFAPWEQLSPNVTQGVLVPCRFSHISMACRVTQHFLWFCQLDIEGLWVGLGWA